MKTRSIVLLIGSLLFSASLFAQTTVETPAAGEEIQKPDEQLAIQDKQKKEPPAATEYDQAPEMVRQFQPDYPNEALKNKLEGTVWVSLWIDESGKVAEAKVTKTDNEIFNQAAMDAGKRWVFKPAIAKGKPVAVWVTVPFRFKLYDGAEAPSMGVPVQAPAKQEKKQNLREKMPPADYVPYEKPPEAIRQFPAKYPASAKKDKIEGTVWVKTLVDEQGKVAKVVIQKSDAEVLNQAAIDAVNQWVFAPAVMKGKPVAVWVSIPFRFKLADDKEKPAKK